MSEAAANAAETDWPARVSVVIPALNEAESLPLLFERLAAALEPTGYAWEAVFVDDGSTDDSAAVMRRLCAADARARAVLLRRNFGKSCAMQAGFQHARGDAIVTIDADLQDDPAEIPAMLEALRAGSDLVVGWKRQRRDPSHRVAASRVFNWCTRRMSGLNLHDMDCGLKAMRREVAACVPLYGELHRFFPVMAFRQGFRVTEQAVAHRERRFGRSRYGLGRILRGAFDFLTVLFLTRYASRPLHFFGKPGLLLMAAGLVINAHLIHEKLAGRYIGHRPLLTLGVLLLILGALFLANGLLGEMLLHATSESRPRLPAHVVRETCGREEEPA